MTKSWVDVPLDSDFSLSNLPFGIISIPTNPDGLHVAVAIGSYALDLHQLTHSSACFQDDASIATHTHVFQAASLNAFAALGRRFHRAVRAYLADLLSENTSRPELLRNNDAARRLCLHEQTAVRMHLPMEIGDYTDFYAGLNHAYNVGVLFRGPQNALQPNYRHLPVGYHGRASSVVVSGTAIRRPWGQVLDAETKGPKFQPCEKLDLELELGAFVCKANPMGSPVHISEAEEYLFGVVLMNDWSARDVQAWEYVPLGPFNSKNFGTTISPWVVLADALEPFRCRGLENNVEPMPYLRESRPDTAYDIALEVELTTRSSIRHRLTKTSASNLLFSFPQMIAHHSITGCPLRTGDLLGSGTISGTEPGTEGALLEQTRGGKMPIKLGSTDETRTFLEDGDTVVIRGWCEKPGEGRVGFGECSGLIQPAIENVWN